MMSRRDLLLNEMKITQWVLAKPQVLKGDAQIRLTQAVKLVVVCEEDHQQSRLFQDILRTLQLSKVEYQWLTFEQSMRLQVEHRPIFWLIQAENFIQQFAQKQPKQTTWQSLSWQAVSQQKREFWQQMQPFCQHFEDQS